MKILYYLCIPATLMLASCDSEQFDQQNWLDRGRETLQPFKAGLKAALQEGLQQGPQQAVAACQLKAPAIAAKLASPDYQLGRTSHRLRNPDNAPREWIKPLLAEYRQGTIRSPRAVPLEQGKAGYVEPIYMQPLCLTCHGSTLDPALASRIRAAYPEDRATGFAAGDFRGLFWVEFTRP